ncbi:MAG: hypothetical protein U9N49_03045, partial [Campylobacterota bacterium]|nr:hypothetical protein [Campylobacterota bacterium]
MEGIIWIVSFLLVASMIGTLLSIQTIYREYTKLTATPYANEALVGCYVKFMGKVVSQDRHKRPLTQQVVAFYQFHVLG